MPSDEGRARELATEVVGVVECVNDVRWFSRSETERQIVELLEPALAAARAEGEAAGRAAERGGVSEDSSEDFDWVRRQIAGALKSAIDAHGPIGMELIGSAAKRITRTVWREFVRRVRAARADERAGVCAILIERQRQHAETEAYHRAEGDLGLARRNQLLAQECGVLLDLFARARAVGGGQ
jgi:Ribonuclease G/E